MGNITCGNTTCCHSSPAAVQDGNSRLAEEEERDALPIIVAATELNKRVDALRDEEITSLTVTSIVNDDAPVKLAGDLKADLNLKALEKLVEETKSQDRETITRESSESNLWMEDIGPSKDTYLNQIPGGRFVAEFKNSDLNESHLHFISGNTATGVAVVSLRYAFCKDVSDQFLLELSPRLGSPSAGLRALTLCFRSCSKISDKGVSRLSRHLPGTLEVLELDFRFCEKISSSGLAAIGRDMPLSLRRLALKFRLAPNLGDAGLAALAKCLPDKLESFEFVCCKCTQVGTPGLLALMQSLSTSLKSLSLSFEQCWRINNDGFAGVAQYLPTNLEVLVVNFWQCTQVGDPGLAALAQRLPAGLKHLGLRLRSCKGITNAGATALAQSLPEGLETLQVDFSQCTQIDDAAIMAFAVSIPETVQASDLKCQNTRVPNGDTSLQTLRNLRTQGDPKTIAEPAKPGSPPDPQLYAVLPAQPTSWDANL